MVVVWRQDRRKVILVIVTVAVPVGAVRCVSVNVEVALRSGRA